MKRAFSKKQKQAVEIVEGAVGDADHITPYCEGGQTMVENCQILTPHANKKKGKFNFVPRAWQDRFLDSWERRQLPDFMLIAIPGSGKTMAALEASRRWIKSASNRRLIVVVPSDNLRTQWQAEALNFGMELQTKELGTNFKDGFQGGVTTYHKVASSPELFRKICSVAPTMVIFDEIHHCGEDSSFGRGVQSAFELAKERLSMSGTPWKTDGQPLPFARYDGDGYALGDVRYDYPDALNDDVIRYLVFHHATGEITNDVTGETKALTQTVTDEEAGERLRHLLDPSGDYVRQQVRDSHDKLMECRKINPDAAALAVCIDQEHARKVAKIVMEETRCNPSIIVSDSSIETDSVDGFRRSNKEWLISVRKVSEGTDIKRLQVLCYLTTYTTELFFRQVIGRVSRVRDKGDIEGYVYLPADPRLIRCAQNITNAQIQAIKDQAEKDTREMEQGERSLEFESYSTAHKGDEMVIIGGEEIPADEARKLQLICETTGMPMHKVREVLVLAGSITAPDPVATKEVGKEERMTILRRKCANAAFRLSKVMEVEPQEVHSRFKPQKKMTEPELQEKLRTITARINQKRP